jgi:hypothetical protein
MSAAFDAVPAADEAAARSNAAPARGSRRDLRLDFFRGLALWFIFLDHIPDNTVSWITVRNYGFSDATEIFVFISGYAAVVAYSRVLVQKGWPIAAAQVLRRVWQLYVAHIMLFVAFTAQIAWVALRTERGAFIEQMNLIGLVEEPTRVIVETALLRFRPVNLDILPLYIVILATFAFALPAVRRAPWVACAGSALVYLLARRFEWNLPAYPDGKTWYFDPFMWQLAFYFGAACAADGRVGERLSRYARVLTPVAVAYLVLAGIIALSWQFNALARLVPDWIGRLIYPIDKTTLDPLRLAHFLALAYLAQRVVAADARFLRWPIVAPLRRCGEHSLMVFCLGTFLSFSAQVWIEAVGGSLLAQLAASVTGIALLTGAAYVAAWYKKGQGAAMSAAT